MSNHQAESIFVYFAWFVACSRVRHSLARVGARGADLGAMHHSLIARDRATGLLTRSAELGACGAGNDMMRRAAQHEIRARLTQFSAVE